MHTFVGQSDSFFLLAHVFFVTVQTAEMCFFWTQDRKEEPSRRETDVTLARIIKDVSTLVLILSGPNIHAERDLQQYHSLRRYKE